MRYLGISAILLLVSTQAVAGVETKLTHCAAIKDKLERLICYDNLAANLQSHAKVQSAASASPQPLIQEPPASPQPVVHNQAEAEHAFGNPKPQQADKEIDKLYFDVASINKDAYGAMKITFTNGQRWKQTENRRFRLKVGDKVYIERAALGSFLLGSDDRNATIRVKRIH